MVYIFETKLNPKIKTVEALTRVYGLGSVSALKIINELGVQRKSLIGTLTKTHLLKLRKIVDKNYLVSSRLRQKKKTSIQQLVNLRTYRGARHKNRLPVRGQRTSTNARTQKKRNG
jgi:small subunit ribosomal protein S13